VVRSSVYTGTPWEPKVDALRKIERALREIDAVLGAAAG
jgi:hypothetical protein